MPRERKRRCAVVVYMDASAAIVDGWHTRDRAIERLHDYRTDREFANYLDGMAIVTLDDNAWPYKPRTSRNLARNAPGTATRPRKTQAPGLPRPSPK
jgi:hypothetical protein